jgi:hypothetical protein
MNRIFLYLLFLLASCRSEPCVTFDFDRLKKINCFFHQNYTYECKGKVVTVLLDRCEVRQVGNGGLYPCENRFWLYYSDSITGLEISYSFQCYPNSLDFNYKLNFEFSVGEFGGITNLDSLVENGVSSVKLKPLPHVYPRDKNCSVDYVLLKDGAVSEFKLQNDDLWRLISTGRS